MIRKYPILALALHLGWVVAFSTFIPLAIGIWADRRWETAPWLTLVGMVVGILASTVGIVRVIQRTYARLEQQYGRSDENEGGRKEGEA